TPLRSCVLVRRPPPCPPLFPYTTLFRSIDPQHKVSTSSALIAVMAAVIVVSVPVVGWLCDRSRPRWGRRRTWALAGMIVATVPRSEEHTSELQSRFDLVCRLLLEKKK